MPWVMTDPILSGRASKPAEPKRRRYATMNWRTSTASSAISRRPKGSISYAYRCLRVINVSSPRISMAPIFTLSEIGRGRSARKRREWDMRTKRLWSLGMAAVAIAVLLVPASVGLNAQSTTGAAVRIDNDDIGGVVTGANGPEAGVWVIAETTDLPTKFAKIVVTDDQGRYVLPDLPKANHNIWVRGYGLVDSPKVKAAPGKIVNLKA